MTTELTIGSVEGLILCVVDGSFIHLFKYLEW